MLHYYIKKSVNNSVRINVKLFVIKLQPKLTTSSTYKYINTHKTNVAACVSLSNIIF